MTFRLHLIDRQDWTSCIQTAEDETLLHFSVEHPAPLGTPMQVEVSFERGPSVELRGQVCWRRPATREPTLAPGVKLSLSREDQPKIAYLNAYAAGLLNDRRQGAQRHSVLIPVVYTDQWGRHFSSTLDVSPGGFSMRREQAPQVGSEQHFLLFLPGPTGTFRILGRVARHIDLDPPRGIGVQLLFHGAVEQVAFGAALQAFVADRRGRETGATAESTSTPGSVEVAPATLLAQHGFR